MTTEQHLNRETFKLILLILLFIGLVSACTMHAVVDSRPSQAASAPVTAASASPQELYIEDGKLVVMAHDDNCTVYFVKGELYRQNDVVFVNCKNGTTAIKGN